jgi:hypothetical protein
VSVFVVHDQNDISEVRLTSNTKVSQTVNPRELIHHRTLLCITVLLPQLPQPDQLEDLLWEEECADEVRVWTEGGKVPVMDVHHIGRRKYAILLQCKIIDERSRRKIPHCGLCIAHAGGCDKIRDSGGEGRRTVTCMNAMQRYGIADAG